MSRQTVNEMRVVGYVGTVNEPKTFGDNNILISFSVATSDYVGKGKGTDGGNYSTTWHDVTAFGKTAEFVQKFIVKGDFVEVRGPISKETFKKKDGTEGLATRIKAFSVLNFSDRKTDTENNKTELANSKSDDTDFPWPAM